MTATQGTPGCSLSVILSCAVKAKMAAEPEALRKQENHPPTRKGINLPRTRVVVSLVAQVD